MTDAVLFEDAFTCSAVDHQKYDRVARIAGTSSSGEISMTLDINIELYSFRPGEGFTLALASTLNNDGSKDDGKSWRDVQKGETTLADHYDYVMYGKQYRFDAEKGDNIEVYVSFGGLLLMLQGPYKKLVPLRVEAMYLLMRKS